MAPALTRRAFLQQSALAATLVAARPVLGANDRLNIAVIGVSGRGASDLAGVAGENIVALCDVDRKSLDGAAAKFPKARPYRDYRRMLQESKDLDAVVVATPDHHHVTAAVMALRTGRHVYCEKPLAHSVHEMRLLLETAAKSGKVTQTGNQMHSHESVIRPVELLSSGAIGAVTEVHSWSNKVFSPGDRPKETPPVPEHLDWDLWLGPAPERPYHKSYVPFHWRGWWDFGNGNLADMFCHIADPAYWALQLEQPETIEVEGPPPHPESAPPWEIARWTFGARGPLPPVKYTWYNAKVPPPEVSEGITLPAQGSIFVGTKGRLMHAHTGAHELHPRKDFEGFKGPEPTLPRPAGADHHRDWIEAIKGNRKAGSDFSHGGRMTLAALLATAAYRVGGKIQWDAASGKAVGRPEADAFLRREPRKGWEI